jgi:hypothetical protein
MLSVMFIREIVTGEWVNLFLLTSVVLSVELFGMHYEFNAPSRSFGLNIS